MNRQTFITSSSLALLILSSSASVVSGQDKPSSPRMLDELDFHTPYSAHNDDVTHATQHGLDARVLRALDHPETPNAERVALITGAVSVDGAEKARGKYLRFLLERNRHHDNVGLDHLEAHELMCAGLLGAMAGSSPPKKRGKHELERAAPILLLTAATNRRRGEMSMRFVQALIKAQDGIDQPARRLCRPKECIDDALAPFTMEWGIRPEAVCATARMVARHDSSKRNFGALSTCSAIEAKDEDAPMFVQDAEAKRVARRHAAGMGASGAPPFVQTVPAPQPMNQAQVAREQLAIVQQAIAELKMQMNRANAFERHFLGQVLRELELQEQQLEGFLQQQQGSTGKSITFP